MGSHVGDARLEDVPQQSYFGTTAGLPPGVPGGGMTGIDPAARPPGCTAMPGSTCAGGFNVPWSRDSRSLIVLPGAPPSRGAIRSGGATGADGGASGGGGTCVSAD